MNAFVPSSASALVILVVLVETRNYVALQNAYVQLTVLNVERTASMVPSHLPPRWHRGLLAQAVGPCPGQGLASTGRLQGWAPEAAQRQHLERQGPLGRLLASVRGNH